MESLVTQFQQAEGIIFLSAPVSGEKSFPPSCFGTDRISGCHDCGACDAKLEKVTTI
jgi:hypothetical protein